ncbi:hypothetical protein NCY62_18975 (plasmid) [Acinetobacter pittii]|uniref:secretion/conjugation apparatus DotM-related subunit n=1 Tax=Acinetobacter calcoaceticus/baumannii complex TaxID=909768 RepID=UPI000AFC9BDE|nr:MULTISPECIES: hypothetical protein [Acinetobacter calcoaceticus/baumannii complex]MBP1472612.1 hypothetical protein [Acinetobacter nosocomialis]MBP9847258.1 hypothetical protein [Saprospiraceae bacterium]MCM1964137.1 hypothetical protein [Acinetobacter pittii]MCM1980513.1 hypothetical protein [Acinetobacter pittii]
MNQHNHRTSDSSTDTLIIVGAIIFVTVGFFWGAWHYGSVAIVKITRTLFGIIELPFWYLQLLIKKITNSDASILNFTTNTISKLCYPDPNHYLNPLMNCTVNIKAIPFNFYYINNLFPSMLIAGALIGYVWYKHSKNLVDIPDTRYVKDHDLESLILELSVLYPHLKYISYFVQSKVPNDKGFYRLMLSPREFVLEYKLVSGFRKYEIESIADFNDEQNFGSSPKDDVYPLLDEKQFEKEMYIQLGDLLNSPKDLTDGEINLFAIFLPVACATDENMSDKEFKSILKNKDQVLDYFWHVAYKQLTTDKKFINPQNLKPRSYQSFNRKKLEKTVSKYWNHPVAQEIFSQHAYARTALIATIYRARMLGVIAPCELRWLRMYDRNLWALVQSVGRPSVFVEQLAAFSHYTSECYYKRKKVSPDFSYGWLGLNEALKRYKYKQPDIYLNHHTPQIESAQVLDSVKIATASS